jgi:hypothetical protein
MASVKKQPIYWAQEIGVHMNQRVGRRASHLWLWAILLCLAIDAPAMGDMVIQGYEPRLHDRYYVGDDRAFVGQQFDWSGVGRGQPTPNPLYENHRPWATMISDMYFVSAGHWHPMWGTTVTFHMDNNPNGPIVLGTVDTYGYLIRTPDGAGWTDLWIGKFVSPIPDTIARYPALNLPSSYIGLTLYASGKPDVVGRNIIADVYTGTKGPLLRMNYEIPGLGDDECFVQPGDSGGCSFVAVGNQLAVVGGHYFYSPSPIDGESWSADTFVPGSLVQIPAIVGLQTLAPLPGDANLNGVVDAADYAVWFNGYGKTGGWSSGDLDGNGVVDAADYAAWFNAYGAGAVGVPEPSAFLLCLAVAAGNLWPKQNDK